MRQYEIVFVIDAQKETFLKQNPGLPREAIEEYHAVPVSTFVKELQQRIDEHFNKNA